MVASGRVSCSRAYPPENSFPVQVLEGPGERGVQDPISHWKAVPQSEERNSQYCFLHANRPVEGL